MSLNTSTPDAVNAAAQTRFDGIMNRPKKLGGNPICERIFP